MIKKLSGVDNYDLWKTQMMLILKTKKLWGIVTGIDAIPSASDRDLFHSWQERDSSASGEIGLHLQDDLVRYHVKVRGQSAKELWDTLADTYDKQDTDSLSYTCQKFSI
jgi:hypothetical protein